MLRPVAVTRIFTGADGRSHFEDLSFPLVKAEPPATHQAVLPFTGAIISVAPAGAPVGRHNAPRRQLVINLTGVCEIDCADGTKRFGPGDVRFADDTHGEGHVTRVVEDVEALIQTLRR
jgi:hypothetical protein